MNFDSLLEELGKEIVRIEAFYPVETFYDPIHYVLGLSGKKIRPLLVVLAAMTLNGRKDDAYDVAAAVELLHNFTLVHDDIMDEDDTRRGQETVHKKWNISTAILAGDGLMGFAFQRLLRTPNGPIRKMAKRFTDAMIIICEGQGLDKEFEKKRSVSLEEYLNMIYRKTASLIELSCELGGYAAGGRANDVKLLREFGRSLGMAFQIQDDVLDIMAEEDTLGKDVGSDLLMHKQTILTILLAEKYDISEIFKMDLPTFKQALMDTGVLQHVREIYLEHFANAENYLKQLPVNEGREGLMALNNMIKNRKK
jgi:geranylgeranyl pyrophosphate synthase